MKCLGLGDHLDLEADPACEDGGVTTLIPSPLLNQLTHMLWR